MATGRLGVADLAAATDTTLYTVPASTFSVITLSVCNRGSTAASIQIAVSSTASPALSEYIEFNTSILGSGVLERTGIVMDTGKRIVIRSNSVGISAVCYGIETSTA